MMDLHRKFDTALRDTVEEWKKRDEVKGIFTYGSVVRGTATANSDLDICMVWDGTEAPARLMAEHKGVIVDMDFMTPSDIDGVFVGEIKPAFQIASIISRLRDARVQYDTDSMLRNWLEKASQYTWPADIIEDTKQQAQEALERSQSYLEKDDAASATNELRVGLFELGRVVLMKNQIFSIIKPSEVLSEVRMLDPMMYQLFLRTFKLKGFDEETLLGIISDVNEWLKITVDRFENAENISWDSPILSYLTQAQRYYYGSKALTLNGDYELAVLEMRRSISMIGRALLALDDIVLQKEDSLISYVREKEPEFYEKILIEYGDYDLQPAGVKRGISEASFLAKRL